MTDLSNDIDLLEAALSDDVETTHYTCCHDDHTALCGTEIDNFDPPKPEDRECNVCEFLATTPFCPRGLTCPPHKCDESCGDHD